MTDPSPSIPVAIAATGSGSYPAEEPFDPPGRYPESPCPGGPVDVGNTVYAAVRESLRLLGLDETRYGADTWNPLGAIVRPGDEVLLKPNLVRHFHGAGLGLESLVTHGSVLRAILDYIIIALQGSGSITIGDAPLQYSDFDATLAGARMTGVIDHARGYAGVTIRTIDFRKERSEKRDGLIVARVPNDGDPDGYREVDLAAESRFAGASGQQAARFRVTQYDPDTMTRAHRGSRHAYLLPSSVLRAQVVINLPKLKTHRKAGITAAMKNLVGINGSKDWLPHHTSGPATQGGDEYRESSWRKEVISSLRDSIERRRGAASRRILNTLVRTIKATHRVSTFPDDYWEGSWHGNDTLWRMVHDLHRALFHADADGVVRPEVQRRYFALVDAVVAGEGEGPMRPTPRPCGLLVAGMNPAAVDTVCCRLMGFDEMKIPLLSNAVGQAGIPGFPGIESLDVRTTSERWKGLLDMPRNRSLRFTPPAGWAGAIEREE